jgi:hypothetical protein
MPNHPTTRLTAHALSCYGMDNFLNIMLSSYSRAGGLLLDEPGVRQCHWAPLALKWALMHALGM